MSTKACPQCGAQYLAHATTCADCGVTLVGGAPATVSENGAPSAVAAVADPLPPAEFGDDDEVVLFDLDEWTADERDRLELLLQTQRIPHAWEAATREEEDEERRIGGLALAGTHEPGTSAGPPWHRLSRLAVGEEHEELMERLLDEVEYPDQLDAVEDDGAEDEANFEVMAGLFEAADRLMHDPDDNAVAGEFLVAAEGVGTAPTPYGIDGNWWAGIKARTAALVVLLEESADDAEVVRAAREIRDELRDYV